MRRCLCLLILGLCWIHVGGVSHALDKEHPKTERYRAFMKGLKDDTTALRGRRAPPKARLVALEKDLLTRIDALHRLWVGSRWGLGMPQSTKPFKGKTNCGLFVAVVLRDTGFRLPIWKFNRQYSSRAIRSVAPRSKIRYFSKTPIAKFVKAVKKLGPGLFLVGLDFHIGFIRYDEQRGVRFVHASYIDKKVVDEPALKSEALISSRNRMIGKSLQKKLLYQWLRRKRIHVFGDR